MCSSDLIWNAFRLVMSWETDGSIEQPAASAAAVTWMQNTIDRTLSEIEENFVRYRISDALMQAYKLFWDDFSGWYLEIIKPAFGMPVDGKTRGETLAVFGTLMKIIHPFMPFITEEIWQRLADRPEGSSIMVEMMPLPGPYEAGLLTRFDTVREIVSAVRAVRKEKNIPLKEQLVLCASPGATGTEFDPVIIRMCNLSEIRVVEGKVEGAASFRIHTSEFFIPLSDGVDHEEEIRKLKEELVYMEGFLEAVLKKLSNEKFVANAPAKVIEIERKKEADARARIATINESIGHLSR